MKIAKNVAVHVRHRAKIHMDPRYLGATKRNLPVVFNAQGMELIPWCFMLQLRIQACQGGEVYGSQKMAGSRVVMPGMDITVLSADERVAQTLPYSVQRAIRR